jgi:hypothetical protein
MEWIAFLYLENPSNYKKIKLDMRDTSNVININGKEYNLSSPTGEEYKKMHIEAFGDEYKPPLTIGVNSNNVDGYFLELKTNSVENFLEISIHIV